MDIDEIVCILIAIHCDCQNTTGHIEDLLRKAIGISHLQLGVELGFVCAGKPGPGITKV